MTSTTDAPGAAFPRLFTPLRVGGATLRNRIVSSGHDTVMAEHGLVSDRLVAYQAARARGGVGLIVIQVAGVHPTARYTSHELTADDDRCIPGFARLAEVAHAGGAVIFGQLFHGGREIMDTEDGTLAVALAPSAVPTERFHVMPRAMPVPLIREIVDGFGASAARLRDRRPRRLRDRRLARLPALAVPQPAHQPADRRVRRRPGAPAAVPARGAGGRSGRDAPRVRRGAADLDRRGDGRRPQRGRGAGGPGARSTREGAMDYVSVVAGTSATLAGSDHIVPPTPWPNGYTAPRAARAKAVVRVPVFVAGRISQPQEAEAILEAGQADACVMTRALICDPELPAKTAAGRLDDIRACIGCNQACIGHFHAGYPISCIQFPESGREREFPRTGEPGSERHPPRRDHAPCSSSAAGRAASRRRPWRRSGATA